MKASLQLKMGQQLTMTPQLQQAIRLLQLSTLDLQSEIQEALESNPMLDVEEGEQINEGSTTEKTDQHDSVANEQLETASVGESDHSEAETSVEDHMSSDTMPDDLPVDSQWDDHYQTTAGVSSSAGVVDDDFDYDGRNSTTENLHDHVLWQLNV